MKKNIRNYLIETENKFWENRRSNLHPSLLQHDYLALISLRNDIAYGLSYINKHSKRKKLAIIDIGSGDKPYLPLFQPYCTSYIGTDISQDADVIAPAEKLPFKNNSFDLALHFQVFEHLEDPMKSVKEMHRVVKQNGFILASTHGIWIHHPFPHDFHRWTKEGLELLFRDFSKVIVKPNLRSTATILQIINNELYGIATRKILLKLPLYLLIFLLNFFGKFVVNTGTDAIAINYIIIAKK